MDWKKVKVRAEELEKMESGGAPSLRATAGSGSEMSEATESHSSEKL